MIDYSQRGILDNLKHQWKVGDLCRCEYNGAGAGIIYRVVEVTARDPKNPQLRIKPVLGIVVEHKGKQTRGISAGWCQPVLPKDLFGYLDCLTEFIRMEEERRKSESV